jgi:Mg-chelatase subunit ChlD
LVLFDVKMVQVVLNLTNMNPAGLKMAEAAIDNLQENGQTNLWDGLHEGLKALQDESGRMKAVLLLTDGQPNINPPRGIVPMFQNYKEAK